MDVFIARQPIFDRQEAVYAYELLFRSGSENAFTHEDPDQASAKVMTDGSFIMGMEKLTDGKPAFINATRDILTNDYFTLLPKELTVVEVLETVEPDDEVLAACRKLKEAGYTLALDDFVYSEGFDELIELADIIKVDFIETGPEERKALFDRLSPKGIRFLAEKVETHEEFQEALDIGYHYFQGYFFSKPAIVSARDVPAFKLNYMRIMRELQRPEFDFKELDSVIKIELSLTYKLLRYINSAYFALPNKVNSIMHAMVLLGEREFKKWVSFVALAGMGEDKPDELVIAALIRAKFCEALGKIIGLGSRSDELFLLGMFSLLDAIMDRPLSELLEQMPISDDIKGALLGEESDLSDLYQYAIAYERGEWETLEEKTAALQLDESGVPQLYMDTVAWAYEGFREVGASAREGAAASQR